MEGVSRAEALGIQSHYCSSLTIPQLLSPVLGVFKELRHLFSSLPTFLVKLQLKLLLYAPPSFG